jgi:hypothetical protein
MLVEGLFVRKDLARKKSKCRLPQGRPGDALGRQLLIRDR